MRRKSNLNRFILCILLIAALLLLGAPALAQDATPEPTAPPGDVTVILPTEPGQPVIVYKDENPALLAALAGAGVLLVLFGGAILVLAHKGYNMLPAWAKDLVVYNQPQIEANVDEGFDALDRMAELTPNTLDDMLVKYGREWVESRIKTFFDDPQPSGVTGMADKEPTPDSRVIVGAVTPVPSSAEDSLSKPHR